MITYYEDKLYKFLFQKSVYQTRTPSHESVPRYQALSFKKFSDPCPNRFESWTNCLQTGVYVPLGIDFPIWKCILKVSNRRKKLCLHIIDFEIAY